MDGSQYTFDSLPRVIGATLGIVCLVLLVAFRSLLVPIRAVLCLVWMLVVTFGSAVLIYQDGALEGLGMGSFAPSEGAIFWMSPCIAFSIVVGLGLDYGERRRPQNRLRLRAAAASALALPLPSHPGISRADVFFMESAVEFYDEGYSGKQAVLKALEQTGNIICVAGVIMFLSFGALIVGKTAALNQIGYLMCVSVLLDCFVTTKLIIPAAMALIPDKWNFYPRVPTRALVKA